MAMAFRKLQAEGSRQRERSTSKAAASEGYELGETALQVAIVLLSIAMITDEHAADVGSPELVRVAGRCWRY